MEIMLLSFLMPLLKEEWNLESGIDGLISAIVFAGMLLGTFTWAYIADRYGRRKVVIISNIGCFIAGLLSGLAPNIELMIASRFFVGFFVGGSSVSYTLFAEYAPHDTRGTMLVIEQGL